ncbi:MAG: sensor histidine kinase [Pyrinomonadaceae bacterium]
MSPLEILKLVGYSTGAALHLWIIALLWRRRRNFGSIERVLLALAVAVGAWHASNFSLALHDLLGLQTERWNILLRFSDSVACISITLAYSLLLHVHLHLWADAQARKLTAIERARVFLSYIPAIFLFISVPQIWRGAYMPMLDKLAGLSFVFGLNFVQAFMLWAIYALAVVAVTDLILASRAKADNERRLMQTLAASFAVIAVLIIAVYVFRQSAWAGLYLQTFANLGSLLPTALLAYHIYRYRYLELIIKESLVIASFAAVVLIVYLYGIRTLGEYATTHYGLRAGALETLLILALALLAAPLRNQLDYYFHKLIAREATLYRDVVARIGAHAGQYERLPELLAFIETRTAESLNLKRVLFIRNEMNTNSYASDNVGVGSTLSKDKKFSHAMKLIFAEAQTHHAALLNSEALTREYGFNRIYILRREDRVMGAMLINAPDEILTADINSVLEVLAGQVGIAIEDCLLVEENARLEERLAQEERLSTLGRMAATIAHEVKNPLSAIKSIAQVMREDEKLSGNYARDLDLIVGETNRLNRSVTQLLSFARNAPPADPPCSVDELMQKIIALFRAEAGKRNVKIELENHCAGLQLDGARASALRDAFSNLLLNALHATAANKSIFVEARAAGNALDISVTDGGAGVDAELSERIWEPFFTTKQRGTGLGLAIVRKRIEEVGGTARLAVANVEEGGARFEIHLPLLSFAR